MKTWKLVSGILSIVLSMIVLLQSCAATVGDALSETGGSDGITGILVTAFMMAGGIVSICVRNGKKSGNIPVIVIFCLAGVIGISGSATFPDLAIWGGWCLICAVLAVIALFLSGKKAGEQK